MAANSIRALCDGKYDYYELTKDFGLLRAGTIFYHDPDDSVYGSCANGCLKNCWTPEGNCYGELIGGTVILHYEFSKTNLFRKIKEKDRIRTLASSLKPGNYDITIHEDGTVDVWKKGRG